MRRVFFIILFFILPFKTFALIEVDITRGNLNPLPIAVSPLSIDENSRQKFEQILKKKDIASEISIVVEDNLRTSGLFPHSTGDELAWLRLLSLREEGYSPPISGPLFVWIIETMAETVPWPTETVLSGAGMMFGALSIFVVHYSYVRYEGCEHSGVIALLFLISTSYFLAPAMEARPQQLGSILLFVTMLRHLSDKYKSPDYWTIILLIILLYVHLFSMVVCSIGLFLLAYTRWLSTELPDSKLFFWALTLSLILSAVWVIPEYSTLLLDIFKHHLLVQTTINFRFFFI